ncbi:MAG: ATP-dependent RecD-like DNA helicase [Anaerorhabdus sp.]
MEKISGKFEYIKFRSNTNYFTVARFKLHNLDEKVILVTGYIEDIVKDTLYYLDGEYIEHNKYGMQFQIHHYQKSLPNDHSSLIRYFSSPLFPGIGIKLATILVETLGEDIVNKIKNDESCLLNIDKLSNKKRSVIINGLKKNDDNFSEIMRFFTIHGLSIRNIVRLNKAYGSETIEKISENPYRVVYELSGFGFKTADKIGKSLGFEDDNPLRIEALLSSLVMDHCMSFGDSYITKEELLIKFQKYTVHDIENYIDKLVLNFQLVVEDNRIYPISQYDSEVNIAKYLSSFPFSELDRYDKTQLKTAIDSVQEKINITYEAKQIEAIYTFFENDFMILTGGPGTGKTTVVQGLIEIFRMLYPDNAIALCAPTGRASKRLSELTCASATTIHSLLKWDLETNEFKINKNDPLDVDLLIIDEFSMVDNWLFYNLLNASIKIKKICVIGDEDQLPSVGPGCILKDIIASNKFPVIKLSHIFRQKEGSDVIELSAQIRNGYFDFSEFKDDVAFFQCNQFDVKNNVISIVNQALQRGFQLKDIQVLSCMYQGVAGIDRLNNSLQQYLNPATSDKNEYKYGYRIFRENDKVLQLKNLAEENVFNGDIGIILSITSLNKQVSIVIDFDGIIVEYNNEQIDYITHAYCISVHKSQGSEYPIVIIPIVNSFSIMLQRKLLYTAITRAKKSLVLLGESSAIQRCIEKIESHKRKTTLKDRIISLIK